MSAPPSISISDVRLIATLCPAVAVLITLTRLGMRVQHSGLWWDDALAFLSAVQIILASVGGWVHFMDPNILTKTTRIAAYYLLSEAFYGTLWSARLSILFSIIRISPEISTRKFLYRAAIAFTIVWAFFFAQLFWVCVPEPNWTELPAPQCTLSLQVPVCQLVTDVLADLLLIAVPIRLFTGSTLERGLKIRLASIFSASILTTVVSLVHAAYILKVGGVDELVAAVVEISVSLIVCNLSVVVTALYRVLGLGEQVNLRKDQVKISSLKFATARSHTSPPITSMEVTSVGSSHNTALTQETETTANMEETAKEIGEVVVL